MGILIGSTKIRLSVRAQITTSSHREDRVLSEISVRKFCNDAGKKTATDDVDLQFGVTGLLKLTAHQQHKLGR